MVWLIEYLREQKKMSRNYIWGFRCLLQYVSVSMILVGP